MVMMEQTRVVNQNELSTYIGIVTDTQVQKLLKNAIKKTFGMRNYEPKDKTTIRYLCPQYLEEYKQTGAYIIRRLDPFQKAKDGCDRCERMGWDYVVANRKMKCSKKFDELNPRKTRTQMYFCVRVLSWWRFL